MVAMRKTAWDLSLDGNRSSSSTSSNDNVDASLQAAYRQAHQEDTLSVLNCMASTAAEPQLEYYVVSGEWMATVLDFLQGLVPTKPECQMVNAALVAEHAVSSSSSSSDEEEEEEFSTSTMRRKRKSSWRTQRLQHSHASHYSPKVLKSGLLPNRDYVLVGPHVWTVLSSKFGYDYALPRKVVACREFESKLGVLVHEEEMPVAVPACGYYTYSKDLASPVVADEEEEEEDADLFPGYSSHHDNQDHAMDTEMEDFHNSSYSTPPKRNVLLLPAPEDDDDELQVATTTTVPTKRKRHASGLGNLGNTCFMNSTIQCLAHSDPLCRYFLSNQYTQDLNRQNPLGTGGELALQFASLLQEMWSSTYGTVYPRSFKTALGKHAEQFMGYDQHDSQEFALYLLDALHEDTNRVTQKPYIEKPEQGQDETDEQAAEVAWKLHLQREDSKVLDYFMGQVKSRVTCPTPGCGRVSTTFDPFMYLSVPIPGSSERTIPVTLVTLENGSYTFSVTIQKLATMETLLEMVVRKYNKAHAITTTKQLVMEDLIIVDVHNSHVYAHRELHHSVDTIRNHDVTRIYQLTPVDDIQRQEQECKRGNPNTLAIQALESSTKSHSSHVLDIATLKELNVGETWIDVLSRYTQGSPRKFDCLLNPKRSSHEDRVEFYQKLQGFIELCHLTSDGGDDDDDDAEMTLSDENPQEDTKASTLPSLQERSQSSNMFQHVNTVQDLAKLEFCSKQFRKHALKLLEASTTKYENGIVIEIVMRRKRHARIVSYGDDQNFSVPLLLRVPSNMTVYGLREELARRLGKYLKTEHLEHHDSKPKPPPPAPCSDVMMDIKLEASNVTPDESNAGSDHQSDAALPMEESSSERTSAASPNKSSSLSSSFDFGSPDLLIMRQIPLTYRRDTFKSRINAIPRQLGMLNTFDLDGGQPMTLANKDDDAEQHTIAELVGDHGRVELNWSEELCKQVFDMQLYEASETVDDPDQKAKAVDKKITVKDCIDKYCHMEQLDESEMWYCNRCKDHVRAWKQFHLYRSPPILIVHLKRFQYSQSTHRRDKIDTFIDFPLEGLDLTNEFTQWTEETKPIYDCYAVSNHFGGLGGGHYTAFALSDDGTWTDFDDSRVTTDVDPKDVVSAAAYVLYYRRRDVVLDGLDEDMDLAVPAIVQDSFYQPAEDHAPIIDFNSLENRMDDDRSIENEVQSTAASSSGSIKTVENEDPFVGSGTFQETLEEFKSTSPSQ